MTRAKARFNRPPDLTDTDAPADVSQTIARLKVALRCYFPGHDDEVLTDEVFGHPADTFAEVLLGAAVFPALSSLQWNDERLAKEDLRQELKSVAAKAKAAARLIGKYPGKADRAAQVKDLMRMLRTMSRDVELAMDHDFVARNYADLISEALSEARISDCAGSIDALHGRLVRATNTIRTPRRSTFSTSTIATELAFQVIRVFEDEGLSTSSSVNCDSNSEVRNDSPVVLCLIDIGSVIGIRLAKKTWSDFAQKALRQGARLQPVPKACRRRRANSGG